MTPIEVIRERQAMLGPTPQAQIALGNEVWPRPFEKGTELRTALDRAFVEHLPTAVPFLWSAAMRQLAASYNLPPHVVAPTSELLPFPAMWWRFEGGDGLTEKRSVRIGWLIVAGSARRVDMLTVVPTSERWAAWQHKNRPDAGGPPIFLELGQLVAGRPFPGDYTTPSAMPVMQLLLQMLSFLESRYVEMRRVPVHPDDQVARLRRAGVSLPEPDVIVVQLRAPVPPANHEREPGTGRDWRYRWMVRGHHRAQWYPSLNAHKVVWIAPHFKGPADAPFKPQLYAVVR